MRAACSWHCSNSTGRRGHQHSGCCRQDHCRLSGTVMLTHSQYFYSISRTYFAIASAGRKTTSNMIMEKSITTLCVSMTRITTLRLELNVVRSSTGI